MAVVMAVCGAITIIGIPWAILYVVLAYHLKTSKLPDRSFLNLMAIATIPIVWCLAPIFLLFGLLKLSHNLKLFESNQSNKKFKTNKDWNNLKAWRRYGAAFGMVGLFILIMVSVLPIPQTSSKSVNVSYKKKYEKSSSLELGQQKIKQKGTHGISIEKVRVVKPVYAYIFGVDSSYTSDILNTHTTEVPKKEIIVKGTKKYQYMWCSSGRYRYFTDKQFKNPDTGFTHSSKDYCSKNGQGKMIKLASNPPHRTTNRELYRPSNKNKVANMNPYVPSNCTKTIIPYKTIRKKVSYLAKGQTKTYGGKDGYKITCTKSFYGYKPADNTLDPYDKTIYIGTGTTNTYTNKHDVQAKYRCDADYSRAESQLVMGNAGASSAMQQIQRAYAKCLRAAGY